MKCPTCGMENPERHLYCARCGSIVVRPVAISSSQIEDAKRAINSAVQRRYSTDMVLSSVWIFVPILILVLIIALVVLMVIWNLANWPGASYVPANLLFIFVLPASVLSYIVLAVLAYKLVKRQNEHFARERELREGVMRLIRAAAGSPQREGLLAKEINAMSSAHYGKENWHNPILWALAVALPTILVAVVGVTISALFLLDTNGLSSSVLLILLFVALIEVVYLVLLLYLLYFLGNGMSEHDGRWNIFIHQARTAMSKLGLPGGKSYRVSRLPERNFALYVVLTIIVTFFVYYWWYTLIKDPNEHFKTQWEFEDHLLSVIAQPLPFTSSASQQ